MVLRFDFPVESNYKLLPNEELLKGNIVRRTVHNVDHINVGERSLSYFLKTGNSNNPFYMFNVPYRNVSNVRITDE